VKLNHSLASAGVFAFTLLVGCSSDSGPVADVSVETGTEDSGQVIIGITDAPGDFAAYAVDVTSIKLYRQDGAQIETLPLSTRIDFAQYVELTEFFTAATVPPGTYTAGSMTLDYTSADIQIESRDGKIVPAEIIQDAAGNTVTSLEVRVSLDNANRLIVKPGIPAHITLDFDLQASNTVDLESPQGVSVVVEPVLLAELSRERSKTHRARGALRRVNVEASAYGIYLRPFHHRLTNDRRFGSLVVKTSDETVFDINGGMYRGPEGLQQLARQPQFTATIAIGKFALNPVRFLATEVYAGSSVPGGDQDVIRGSVISRTGDSVIVKGAQLVRADGTVTFSETVTVSVSDRTRVTRQASAVDAGIQDISVGQRVNVTGKLVRSSDRTSELDATEGSVRLLVSYLSGGVADLSTGLVVDLASVNGRTPDLFDYSGTGVAEEFDADPSTYEIATGGLSLVNIDVNSAIRVAGHVAAFGMAPADFDAQTVVNLSNLRALMRVTWDTGNSMSLDTSSQDAIVIDLEGAGRFHHISQAGTKLDLLAHTNPPVLRFNTDAAGTYVLVQSGQRQVHTRVSEFLSDLDQRLAEGAAPTRLRSPGQYDNAENTLSTRHVVIFLNTASAE